MKILNYDVEDDVSSTFKKLYDFMPTQCFRLLITGPSSSGKSNLLLDMIYRLLYFDKIFLYAKNVQEKKYQHLLNTFDSITRKPVIPLLRRVMKI